jgi:REP element-mobilizing transposase RayT
MHVTVRVVEEVPSLRTEAARGVVEGAIERANVRGPIRVIHYSVQSNHVHLIVEADDRASMSNEENGSTGLLRRSSP